MNCFCSSFSQQFHSLLGETQIFQHSGRHSCKILPVNALIWQISCKNLARFLLSCKILAKFLSSCKILAKFLSSCKILAKFLSSCKILARFKFSCKTLFHRLPLLKIFWQLKQSFLQNGKGFNAEKLSFLFGVHPIQFNAK